MPVARATTTTGITTAALTAASEGFHTTKHSGPLADGVRTKAEIWQASATNQKWTSSPLTSLCRE